MHLTRRCPSIRYATALCIAVLLTACTSSGRLHVATPATRLGSYKTMLVHVSSDLEDAKKEAIQLEATVAMIVRQKLSFQQVLTKRNSQESSVDLAVEARIVRLEKVTPESRQDLGWLAGQARLTADVVLIDVKTGAVVARFTAEGQSSVVGTTEQAIKRASEQIAAFVAAHVDG
jgi:uncharacterized protein DUF4410